ncbi:MAG: DciA family protein [Sulfurovum sp.]|nr:DciA family protein [Sulfurovum sp.]MDD3499746.1 DciA family protein [Sulfurovum sp.]
MKSAHTILSHLQGQPQFRYLKRHECYQKYIRLLGEKYQKAIAFVYIRQNTLFVAVTHPGFKMELNYNKEVLKDILSRFALSEKNCSMLQADKVVIFHSKYHKVPAEAEESSTIPHYYELAEGEFEVSTGDAKLQEKFEAIRKSIKKNR